MIKYDEEFGYYLVKISKKDVYYKKRIIKKTKVFVTLDLGRDGIKFNLKTNRGVGFDAVDFLLLTKHQYEEGIKQENAIAKT